MKRRGFTLVELLAVVTIMGVILLISVPNITKQLKKTNSNKYSEFVEDIFLATESYITSYRDSIDLSTGVDNISVERLVKAGYFKSTTINPKTNKKVNINSYVIVSLNDDGTFEYKYIDEDISVCINENKKDNGDTFYYCDPGDGNSRKFYLLKKSSDEMVLIMDKNLGNFTSYDSAISYLKDVTKNWYNVDVIMPSGADMAQYLKIDGWSSSSEAKSIESGMLNDNLNCSLNSCSEKVDNKNLSSTVLGYWVNSYIDDYAWVVTYNKFNKVLKTDTGYGVRPIIIVRNGNVVSE